jgi:hypothetical protein
MQVARGHNVLAHRPVVRFENGHRKLHNSISLHLTMRADNIISEARCEYFFDKLSPERSARIFSFDLINKHRAQVHHPFTYPDLVGVGVLETLVFLR